MVGAMVGEPLKDSGPRLFFNCLWLPGCSEMTSFLCHMVPILPQPTNNETMDKKTFEIRRKKSFRMIGWYITIISALGRLRQEYCKFKARSNLLG